MYMYFWTFFCFVIFDRLIVVLGDKFDISRCPKSWTLLNRPKNHWCIKISIGTIPIAAAHTLCSRENSKSVLSGVQDSQEYKIIADLARRNIGNQSRIALGARRSTDCRAGRVRCFEWTDDVTTGNDAFEIENWTKSPESSDVDLDHLMFSVEDRRISDVEGGRSVDGALCGMRSLF
ncbi:unnamed protein product [Caenorhabditis angaria]|uniref:C-type lectin domain-containing protein n=1 Tax=Caenorhabditis angaria TaxID=860376 RepID=A0A9P1ILR3_9PELO|nr:unnamed protein product [Caenorhabditis angaria]